MIVRAWCYEYAIKVIRNGILLSEITHRRRVGDTENPCFHEGVPLELMFIPNDFHKCLL